MAKTVDISSKRLIGLSATAWVQWLTGDAAATAQEVLGSELQFTSRTDDILIKVHSARHGDYLVANEIQLKVDPRMSKRMLLRPHGDSTSARPIAARTIGSLQLTTWPVLNNR